MGVRNLRGQFTKGYHAPNGFKMGHIPHNSESLEGDKYNRLLVVGDSGERKNGNIIWDCICDCGKKTKVRTSPLKSGQIKSCGCLQTEILRDRHREKNPVWKGDMIGYQGAHDRINKERGKPSLCDECGTTDKDKRYEWANLSGDYQNIYDYKRLCDSCHSKLDKIEKNFRQKGVTAWASFGKRFGYWKFFEDEAVRKGQIKLLDHIASEEGWEETRDLYAEELGLPIKYPQLFAKLKSRLEERK